MIKIRGGLTIFAGPTKFNRFNKVKWFNHKSCLLSYIYKILISNKTVLLFFLSFSIMDFITWFFVLFKSVKICDIFTLYNHLYFFVYFKKRLRNLITKSYLKLCRPAYLFTASQNLQCILFNVPAISLWRVELLMRLATDLMSSSVAFPS